MCISAYVCSSAQRDTNSEQLYFFPVVTYLARESPFSSCEMLFCCNVLTEKLFLPCRKVRKKGSGRTSTTVGSLWYTLIYLQPPIKGCPVAPLTVIGALTTPVLSQTRVGIRMVGISLPDGAYCRCECRGSHLDWFIPTCAAWMLHPVGKAETRWFLTLTWQSPGLVDFGHWVVKLPRAPCLWEW